MNKNWLDHVEDSSIEHVFNITPTLDAVRLHSILLEANNNSIVLRFDFATFPEPPPNKWADKGYNTVQVTLLASDISDFQLLSWDCPKVVKIRIEDCPPHRLVILSGSGVEIRFSSTLLFVQELSAYCFSERD